MICANCIGETYLRKLVSQMPTASCDICGEADEPAMAYADLADLVGGAFEEHFRRTPTQPSAMEYAAQKEGLFEWYQEGEPATDVIAEACGIGAEAAEAIRQILEQRHADHFASQCGDQCEFESEAQYERRQVDVGQLHQAWAELERSLKTEARYFNEQARTVLDEVFSDLAVATTHDDRAAIRQAGPGTDLPALFRARVFQGQEALRRALEAPDGELAAPPSRQASAGRMNAQGVSVFYGATEARVATSEVRPPVGARVLVGRFEFARTVRLLDIEALKSLAVEGSIFDPEYARRLQRAHFLEALAHRITQPVMPDDQSSDYLVTQAMADYLAARKDLMLDGIAYASSQGAAAGFNVALFNRAAKTQRIELPAGSTVEASLHDWDDDGEYPNYWVFERVPKPAQGQTETPKPPLADMDFDAPVTLNDAADGDYRQPTLRLDLDSLQVLQVNAVSYEAEAFTVTRLRSETASTKKF